MNSEKALDRLWDLALKHDIRFVSAEPNPAHAAEMADALPTGTAITADDIEAVVVSCAEVTENGRNVHVIESLLRHDATPVRVAIVLHELGHLIAKDAIGSPHRETTCELRAWAWALREVESLPHYQWTMACHEVMACGLEQRLFETKPDGEPTEAEIELYKNLFAWSCALVNRSDLTW